MCGGGSRTNGEVVRSYRFKFHIVKAKGEPPCIPQKLPYAKVFDRTHGDSFAFIESGEFKPLRPVGDLGGKECEGRPRIFRKNCPTRKFLTKHMGASLRLSRAENLNRSERGGDLGERRALCESLKEMGVV